MQTVPRPSSLGTPVIATVDSVANPELRESEPEGSLLPALLFAGMTMSVFAGPMNIAKSGTLMEVGLDWQVAMKLAVSAFCGLVALWGVLTTTGVRRVLLTIPAVLLILILLLAFPSALSGYSSSALPATLINLAYVAFIATCLVYLKEKSFFYAIVLGTLIACAVAWLLYIVFPEYGVFQEFLGSVTVERLGGHSHPNSVGRTAAIGLLATAALWRDQRISSPITFWLIVFFSITVVYTLSRTVMLGTAAALAVMFIDRLKTPAGIQWLTLGSIIVLLGVFVLIATGNEGDTLSKFAGSVSKTGDTTELTTGTGRVDIWAEAIRVISQKPITGYGFGAAQELLIEYSQSTHNMFLHAAMVAGVFGGVLMVFLALWLVNVSFNGQFRPISALAVFVLVSGMVEDTVLETFPGPATLSFFACCLCPIARHYGDDETIIEGDENEPDPVDDMGDDQEYERPRHPR